MNLLIAGQAYRNAALRLDRALRDGQWDALPPNDRDVPIENKPPAVILDTDETVLDHGADLAKLVREGWNSFCFCSPRFPNRIPARCLACA